MKSFQVSEPDISPLEKRYVNEALDSGWISSTGKFVDKFETDWAAVCESKYALSVANGTVALHLILAALNIGPGDEVIVPSLTFIATANAVSYVGAKAIFADSRLDTWNIDTLHAANLINEKTKAIIAVHLYGNPCEIMKLKDLCDSKGIYLIEDAAEAPFAEVNSKRVGSFGIASSFSFYGNKVLTSGEGGAVTTSDQELYKRMKLLRGQGMDPSRRYFFSDIGYNFRLTNLQCALLCAQLDRKEEILKNRDLVFHSYNKVFESQEMLIKQTVLSESKSSPWLFSIILSSSSKIEISNVMSQLANLKIETRPFFIPIHTLPMYSLANIPALPNAEQLGKNGISLPTSSLMSPDDAAYIGKHLVSIISS